MRKVIFIVTLLFFFSSMSLSCAYALLRDYVSEDFQELTISATGESQEYSAEQNFELDSDGYFNEAYDNGILGDYIFPAIIRNQRLEDILNSIIEDLGVEDVRDILSKEGVNFGFFRESLVYWLKEAESLDSLLEGWSSSEYDQLFVEAYNNMSEEDKEYIRFLDLYTLFVISIPISIPDYFTVRNVVEEIVLEKEFIEEDYELNKIYLSDERKAIIVPGAGRNFTENFTEIDLADVWEYRGEILRAAMVHIASLHYSIGSVSEPLNRQAEKNINYWLRLKEYIPSERSSLVKDKTLELLGAIGETVIGWGSGDYLSLGGLPFTIYELFGGKPEWTTKTPSPHNTPYYQWGKQCEQLEVEVEMPDLETSIETVNSEFGTLIKGANLNYEELKGRVNNIGPVIVGLTEGETKRYVKVTYIGFPHSHGLLNPLNWTGFIVEYEDTDGNIERLSAKGDFIPNWDGYVYFTKDKSGLAMYFDESDVIKYSPWDIGKFDEIISEVSSLPLESPAENPPYWHIGYTVGGDKSWDYVGYYQVGSQFELTGNNIDEFQKGTALAFDILIENIDMVEYLTIELEFADGEEIRIISADELDAYNWETVKLSIDRNFTIESINLKIGIIGKYPGYHYPTGGGIYIDNISIE